MDGPPIVSAEEWQRAEDRALLSAALSGLPRRQREAIVLRFLCDLSVEATADVLGCTPSSVKSLTHRGIAALRAGGRAAGFAGGEP